MRATFGLLLVAGCAEPALSQEAGQLQTLDGALTWEARFEDGTRCTYTRTYRGVEDRSAPWLCPGCDIVWRADLVDFEGGDCLARVSDRDPAPVEWLGMGPDGWYRSTLAHSQLTLQGTVERDNAQLRVSHAGSSSELATGASVALEIVGELDLDRDLGDPLHGWSTPAVYTCGWPSSHLPSYEGPWTVTVGEMLPDGWFRDRCDQPVRLHDFAGRYLVIDISASDCGPCQVMAATERDFLAKMRTTGLPVEVVTLIVPSLSAILDPAPIRLLEQWSDHFDIRSPVLGDRGWGLFVAGPAASRDFGYPTSVIVGPTLEVLDVSVGFGSWDYHEKQILQHARR